MIDRSEAEEHLRVIRSLMEKATIYRAISAEAAAVGGVLALAASFAFGNCWTGLAYGSDDTREVSNSTFVALWISVLVVTALVNCFFLWRAARKRNEPFVSSGMRMALRAVLPSYVVAGFLTAAVGFAPSMPNLIVPVWILCHGLALLATAHFAPRSLAWLGWAFVAAGLWSAPQIVSINFTCLFSGGIPPEEYPRYMRFGSVLFGQQWMAYTFSLLHLIYAVCTWPRRAR
jgi:hypothetical protein